MDKYLANAYAHCKCDQFSLQTPSFRQWARECFPEDEWKLDTVSPAGYKLMWDIYIDFVNGYRREMVGTTNA